MNEPWFDANLYAWIPGTVLGSLGGIWGALVGTLGPFGKAKWLLMGAAWLLLAAAAVLLVLGVIALASGQPYGISYGLLLPGVGGLFIFGLLLPVAVLTYRQAEQRRIEAKNL
jgi:hypothetical protein